ncbi:MAG: hypothetical protein V2J24_20180 [Pseudomonadales bacterium]|nr:hypothetical protein [Pseudomonadales bacterium]
MQVTLAGAAPVWKDFMVVPAAVFDSLILGTDNLQVDTVQIEGADATDTINAQADLAISDASLATAAALATVDGIVDQILVDTDATIPGILSDMQGAGFVPGTDSLVAIRDRGDAAWVTGAGGSSPSAADIRAEIDANSTQLAAIVADTNELQQDLANGGRLDLIFDAILVDTGSTIPDALSAIQGTGFVTGTDSLSALRDRGDAAWVTGAAAPTAAAIRAEMDANSTRLAEIVADTNEIQGDLADGGRLDLIFDAIVLDTGTTIPDQISGLNDISVTDILTASISQPSVVPGASAQLQNVLGFLGAMMANEIQVTATTRTVRNAADNADLYTGSVDDDLTTATRGGLS